jgi:hypothetical protein
MALAYALDYMQRENIATLTNYGEYLEKHPPSHEARIVENSSWSCDHGVERWKSNCGCNTGGHPDWNQNWRGPLRAALDWLRDTVAPLWERSAAELLKDPWAARDGYIDLILDRSPESRGRFFEAHASKTLSEEEQTRVLKLLELQRQAMLMYTSCGWFFDELSGIETVQVIMYAGRVVQLARNVLGQNLEGAFEEKLAAARGNVPEHPDGRSNYESFVRPAMIDLQKVGGHYAIKSLFSPGPADDRVYCYDAELLDHHRRAAGRAKMLVGRARLRSRITGEQEVLSFGVLHLGDHVLSGGVRPYEGDAAYDGLVSRSTERFDRGDYTEVLRVLDGSFGGSRLNLRTLFKDEQRAILDVIFEGTLRELEAAQRQTYQNHGPLLRFLASISVKAPDALLSTASAVLNAEVRRAMRPGRADVARAAAALQEAREQAVGLDRVGIAFDFEHVLDDLAASLAGEPLNAETLVAMNRVLGLAQEHHLPVRLWLPQNVYYDLMQTQLPDQRAGADSDEAKARWVQEFTALAERLRVRLQG